MVIKIMRGSAAVDDTENTNGSFKINERTVYVQRFLGENYIQAEVETRKPLNITIGDYIMSPLNGRKYYVNTLPSATKTGTNRFAYSIVFESEYYDLAKIQYRGALDTQSNFYLYETLEGFVDLLITNLNRTGFSGGWTNGGCTQSNTEYRLMKFEAENCREVMQRLCIEFRGEFGFNKRVIRFSDENSTGTGWDFEYKSGLRNITRDPIETGNLVTRLYALGSDRNLGSAYVKEHGLRLELNTGGKDYIENNDDLYGIIEQTVVFDEIFPRYTGTVTSTSTNVKFIDSSFPFNINDELIPEVTAKVNFLTGDCAGHTFDIYAATGWTPPGPGIEFEVIPVTLQDGTIVPDATLNPADGDDFVVFDIKMPAAYLSLAEDELLVLAQAHLAKYDHPRVTYRLVPDWRYMKTYNRNLTVGDTITINDTDLGISTTVRIFEMTQQLLYPYKYQLSLTDQIQEVASGMQKMVTESYKTSNNAAMKIAAAPIVADVGKSRRAWRDTQELEGMVFDPDGYYYGASIKPLSIETTKLAAGSKSGNFELNGVVIEPNYGNDNDAIHISAGTLTHMNIDDSEADAIGTWTLVANSDYDAGGLTTGTSYYIYAYCKKDDYAAGTNQLILSATQYQADQTDYWYFLVGILHSTAGSTPRHISLSYGQTLINGGHITTGTVDASVVTVTNLNASNISTGTLVVARTEAKNTNPLADQTSINTAANAASYTGSPISTTYTAAKNTNVLADQTSVNIAAAIANLPATPAGAGLYADATHLGYHNGTSWTSYIGSDGKFYFTGNATNAIAWDGAILTVRGSLNAIDITAGTLTGRTVQTAASGQRIILDQANNTLKMYRGAEATPCVTLDDEESPLGGPSLVIGSVPDGYGRITVGDGITQWTQIRHDSVHIYSGAATVLQVKDTAGTVGALYSGINSSDQVTSFITPAGLFSAVGNIVSSGGHVRAFGGFIDGASNTGIDNSAAGIASAITISGGIVTAITKVSHIGQGGAVHADVIAAGADGFMTGADKTKLNGIAALADVTGSNAPQAHNNTYHSTNYATETNFNNHVGAIGSAVHAGAQTVAGGGLAGFLLSTEKDKLAGIPSLGTIATQDANAVAITGGAIDGTTVGATTRSTGRFSNIAATYDITAGGNVIATTAFKQGAYTGVTGTFTDGSGNSIVVRGGIITALT